MRARSEAPWIRWAFPFAVFAAWLALTIALAISHEPWRDEVRAFTTAMEAHSFLDLPRVLANEGHPVLWYVLIRAAAPAFGPASIKVLSLALSAAAVFLVLLHGRGNRWLRALFVFGALTVYEFPVVSQNYSLAFALFAAFAVAWPSRHTHPLLIALILAALANVNAHATIFASLLALYWLAGAFPLRRPRATLVAALLFAVALLCAAAMIRPTTATQVLRTAPDGLFDLVATVGQGVAHLPFTLDGLLPGLPPALRPALLLLLLAGLLVRPAAAAVAALGVVAFAASTEFYTASSRHQGMLYLFLLVLYQTVLIDRPAARAVPRALHHAALLGALPALLLLQTVAAIHPVTADLTGPHSMTKALAKRFAGDPGLAGAVIVAEPDFLVEALPYYLQNEIYIVREGRYGHRVRFEDGSRLDLDLAGLLAAARRVRAESGRPVVIVIGHDLPDGGPGAVEYPFKRRFLWTAGSLADYRRATLPIGIFRGSMTGEDFRADLLRP
jgi:hypothetical protein